MATDKKEHYNSIYAATNYFRYREWLYAPYVSSLISFIGLKPGSLVLDVGCGQGFFSYLFSKYGMKVHGIDMSETGIRVAKDLYGRLGIVFETADIDTVAFPAKFDCIFVRSCSLYNSDKFATCDEVSVSLLRHLKEGGIFVFAYNSTFASKPSPSWRYHSLRDVGEHFRKYRNGRLFFTTKIDTWLIRRYAFNSFVTRLNVLLSKACGIGGDLIFVLRGYEGVVPPKRR